VQPWVGLINEIMNVNSWMVVKSNRCYQWNGWLMKSLVCQQNRHQKVLNRGLNICAASLDILKFEQTSCFILQLGLCFGRAKPTEEPSLWRRDCVTKLQLAFNAIDLE